MISLTLRHAALLTPNEIEASASVDLTAVASNTSVGEKICNGSVDIASIAVITDSVVKVAISSADLLSIATVTVSVLKPIYGSAILNVIGESTSSGTKVGINTTLLTTIAFGTIDYTVIKDFELFAVTSRITRSFTEDSILTSQYSGLSAIVRTFTAPSKLRN